MTLAFRSASSNASNGSPVTLTAPTGTAIGDFQVLALRANLNVNGGWTVTATDGSSQGWVKGYDDNGGIQIWTRTVTANPTTSTLVSLSSTQTNAGAHAVALVGYSGGASGFKLAAAASGSLVCPAVSTTADAVDLRILLGSVPSGSTAPTAPASTTQRVLVKESVSGIIAIIADGADRAAGAGSTATFSGSPSTYSAFTLAVVGNVAPNAPTLNSPANNSTLDNTGVQRFAWTFSDPNTGDSQSQFDLRYSSDGGSTWATVTRATAAGFNDFAAGTFAAGSYQWQVRTYDAQGLVGPWSASSFFTAAAPPSGPTITYPTSGGTVNASDSVTWSYPSQTDYQVRTVGDVAGAADTSTVYTDTGDVVNGAARSVPLLFAVNNQYEHIQVRIKAGGLWSAWADVRVLVFYTPPATPTLTLGPGVADADGYVSTLMTTYATAPATGQVPSATSALLEYSPDGGATVERSVRTSTVTGEDTFWTPASGVDYAVRVTVTADNGTSAGTGWIGSALIAVGGGTTTGGTGSGTGTGTGGGTGGTGGGTTTTTTTTTPATVVQTKSAGSGTGNTATLTFASTPAVGDLLIAAVSWSDANGPLTAPAGWTQTDDAANDAHLRTYYRVSTGGADQSTTWTTGGSSGYLSVAAWQIHGQPTSWLQGHSMTAFTSADPSASVATTSAGTLVLAAANVVGSGTGAPGSVTLPAGWTADGAQFRDYIDLATAHLTTATSAATTVAVDFAWGSGISSAYGGTSGAITLIAISPATSTTTTITTGTPPSSGTTQPFSLGVHITDSGGTQQESLVPGYETWLGQPVQVVTTFAVRATEAQITNPRYATDPVNNAGKTPCIAYEILLSGSSETYLQASVGSNATSSGSTFNARHTAYANAHKASCIAAGNTDLTKMRPFIRLCSEFNNSSSGNPTPLYQQSLGGSNATNNGVTPFIAAYRVAYTAIKAVLPYAVIGWDPAPDPGDPTDYTVAYPGDAYVDAIFTDIYDAVVPYNSAWTTEADQWSKRFNGYSGGKGYKFIWDFANAHGKPVGIPELGLGWYYAGNPSTPWDVPYFVQQIYAALTTTSIIAQPLFASFWEAYAQGLYDIGNAGGGKTAPNATAQYKALFGGKPGKPWPA